MRILRSAPPPHHFEKISGALPDGRKFIVTFRADRTAVVEDEVAQYVLSLTRGHLTDEGEAAEDAASTVLFPEEQPAMEAAYADLLRPFPDKINPLTMPELRPSYLNAPPPAFEESGVVSAKAKRGRR